MRSLWHCLRRARAEVAPTRGNRRVHLGQAGPPDPVKETLDKLIASGAGTLVTAAKKSVASPFADAQAKLKTATHELVKSQNELNHQRVLVLQAREKLGRLEAGLQECDQACRDKMAAHQAAEQLFERLVQENKLKAPPTGAEAQSNPATVQAEFASLMQAAKDRVSALEAEIASLRARLGPTPAESVQASASMSVEPTPANLPTEARSRSPVGNRKKARVDGSSEAAAEDDPEALLTQSRKAAAACQQVLAAGVPPPGPSSSASPAGSGPACG